MARKVFFSFHYERDVWRASQIRSSGVTQDDAGFVDAADWEEVQKRGSAGIKKWIDEQLVGTSVTVVLIGAETSNRDYVKYELEQSWNKGNGILGIYIHQLEDQNGKTDTKGSTSFDDIFTSSNDDKKYFHERFHTYNWKNDNGYENFDKWVEISMKNTKNN